MKLRPSESLTEEQVQSGLKLVIKDSLTSEAVATLTGGAFLVAMALNMGASNFQIGLLAALPTIANIFQLVSIWLVQRYNNRRAITVITSILGRFPLFMIAVLPLIFKAGTSIQVLIFLLFFHYFFSSVAGASWNSWMKDLVPEKMLGTFFSHRGRMTQIISVTLSLMMAIILDYIKSNHPQYEMITYSIMFVVGGSMGMLGVYLLSRTPEPKTHLVNENIFKLLSRPLKDKNFRRFLVFNSFWAFSLNMATPFISVYLMKTILLPLSYIIGLGIVGQISGILFIKFWGRFTDKYSNKTIISICAPFYIGCIFAWTLVTKPSDNMLIIPLLLLINICTGISTSGINLAISNIGMKLAPKGEAIVYISTRSMVTSLFPAIAPIVGGLMADFFATHQLSWSFQWTSPQGVSMFQIIKLQHWKFFFIIGGVLAMLALRMLKNVKEEGEVKKEVVLPLIVAVFKIKLKDNMIARSYHAIMHRPSLLQIFSKDRHESPGRPEANRHWPGFAITLFGKMKASFKVVS